LDAFEIDARFLFERFIACLPGKFNSQVEPFFRILMTTLLDSTATGPKIAGCCHSRFAGLPAGIIRFAGTKEGNSFQKEDIGGDILSATQQLVLGPLHPYQY